MRHPRTRCSTLAFADRPARIVRLTAKGSTLIGRVFEEHARDMDLAFTCLSAGERESLANLLRKLGREADGFAAEKKNTHASQLGKGRS